jgi:predicted metal-dependent hydrolase
MQRRLARERIDLRARTRRLARELDLPLPASVEWSDRQQHRWGSCTPVDRCIRVSSRLAAFPTWVLDYVLVHELAHLRHADHGAEFHALVDRYSKSERAIGFLIAQSIYPPGA